MLSDKILTPGEGQVRALINVGGNPEVAWPDQERTCWALKTIDLSVKASPPVSKAGGLEMMPAAIDDELAEVLASLSAGFDEFTFRLISQRLKHLYNPRGRDLDALMKKGTTNPVYMHPDDLGNLGICPGDEILLQSRHGQIPAIVEASANMKPGVISMAQAWGDLPGVKTRILVREIRACIGMLVSNSEDLEKVSGMPRFSSIPVNVIMDFGKT